MKDLLIPCLLLIGMLATPFFMPAKEMSTAFKQSEHKTHRYCLEDLKSFK